MRHLIRFDDLTDDDVTQVLARADELRSGTSVLKPASFDVGLLFLTSSLRTRVGFTVAAGRLGGRVVDVNQGRWDPKMSAAESFSDTLRTLSGMVDLVIVRCPFPLGPAVREAKPAAPVINAGDDIEHPSQALVDLFAMESMCGPIETLSVALVGDLRMRAARSMLRCLARRGPRSLKLFSPPGRGPEQEPTVGAIHSERLSDLEQVDVLYAVGLPAGSGDDQLNDDQRQTFAVTPQLLDRLGDQVTVLSPMPVVDEITPEARADRRVRIFEQADRSVWVRMALIELVLAELR